MDSLHKESLAFFPGIVLEQNAARRHGWIFESSD